MKKFSILLCALMGLIICANAQQLKFMDVAMDCGLEDFCKKVTAASSLQDTHVDPGLPNCVSAQLKGQFEQFADCEVSIKQKTGIEHVTSVIVKKSGCAAIDKEVDALIEKFDGIYGKHAYTSIGAVKKNEWQVDGGKINILKDGRLDEMRVIYTPNE